MRETWTRRELLLASGRLFLGSSVAAPLAAQLLVAGCATPRPRPPRHRRLRSPCSEPVVLTVGQELPRETWAWVETALPAACARLARFSLALSRPTEVRVYGSHRAFQAATGRRARWLRAWTGFDVVHLLPPALWSDGGPEAQVERLAHELCHAAVFQRFGDEASARRAALPFWLLEGAASVVAGQAARRMPLALAVERAGERDPLRDDGLRREDHHVAYGAAHHAVALLVERHGDGVIAALLDGTRASGSLVRALEEVCGVDEAGLWPAVRAQARTKAGASMRPSNSMPRAWASAL